MPNHNKTRRRGVPGVQRAERRRGVALILVLGMLAPLMLLAVAFSVTMRADRIGASAHVYKIYSQELVWAGLARAIDDIEQSMAGPKFYPDWKVKVSGPGPGDSAKLMWGEVMDYVPNELMLASKDTSAFWVDAVQEEDVRGRVSYMILNASGQVDANFAGGSNRWVGRSPSEMDLSGFAEVLSPSNFVYCRENYDVRYETSQELFALQNGVGLHTNQRPDRLVTYSRFPEGRYDGSSTNIYTDMVSLRGSSADLQANDIKITQWLGKSGIDNSGVWPVFWSLLDYIDVDSVPTRLDMPCPERVPMINEMMVTGGVQVVGATAQAVFQVRAEWFYPFIVAASNAFDLYTEIEATLVNIDTGASGSSSSSSTLPTGYVPGVNTERYASLIIPPVFVTVPGTTGHVYRLQVDVKAQIQQGGTVVDSVPWPWSEPGVRLTCKDASVDVTPLAIVGAGKECMDPRFNWDADNSSMWIKQVGTLGSTLGSVNDSTKMLLAYAKGNPSLGYDHDTAMYVADRGYLVSLGELGYLPRGRLAPQDFWKTVRLFDHVPGAPGPASRMDKVLYYFTLEKDEYRKGLVNINTSYADVLRAVFTDTAIGYPENVNRLTPAQVTSIVAAIRAKSQSPNQFMNMSDIGALDWRGLLPTLRDVERESIIAHSYQMMGTRQNLFAILIASGPFSRGLGRVADRRRSGDWLGYQRALAYIWRDPVPQGENQSCPYHICSFRWLTED